MDIAGPRGRLGLSLEKGVCQRGITCDWVKHEMTRGFEEVEGRLGLVVAPLVGLRESSPL